MTVVNELLSASILTLSTLLLVGIFLVLYYSLGLPIFILFLFVLYVFVINGVQVRVDFKRFDQTEIVSPSRE